MQAKNNSHNEYLELIKKVHYFDEHVEALVQNRNRIIEQIRQRFGKTDENIEFELNKLKE